MRLDSDDETPFEPFLSSVAETALGALGRFAETRGVSPAECLERMRGNALFRKAAYASCHKAFQQAQDLIGTEVVALERRVRSLEREIRDERRRGRTWTHLELKREILANRILVLRRLVDSLLHTLLGMRPWAAKRLTTDDASRRVDPDATEAALAATRLRNGETFDRFALSADLTTFAHVGDLIELDLGAEPPEIRVIELKSGEVNAQLAEAFRTRDQDLLRQIVEKFGESALKQGERMLRQIERGMKAAEGIVTDRGVHGPSGRPLVIGPEIFETRSYQPLLAPLLSRAKIKGIASLKGEAGLRLVAVRAEADREDLLGELAHLFFHEDNPNKPCLLETDQAALEEAQIREQPPVVDLVEASLGVMWSRPIFLWELDREAIMDLVLGRTLVFAQFNAEAFRRALVDEGYRAEWLDRSASDKLRQEHLSGPILGGPPGTAGLQVGRTTQKIYLAGFFARVVTDHLLPQDLAGLIAQDRRAGQHD